jgi:hypothetical protein
MIIPFCGPTYNAVSPNLNCSRSVNFYPELAPDGSRSVMALIGTPGTVLWAGLGKNTIRGMHVFNGLLYVVSGNGLYSVSPSGAVSSIPGTLASTVGRVQMKNNGLAASGIGGNQLMITDGANGYIYNVNTGIFTTISGGGWPGKPTTLDYIDGYFVIGVAGSMSAYASNLYDGTTWNALATSPVSASPDPIQCVFNLHQQLWIIKQHTSEVWYDAGTPTSTGFPFARMSGAVIDYGTVAPWSVARGDNSIFFLASARNNDAGEFVGVVELAGGTPQIISTAAITYQMGQFTTITDAFGYCYSEGGHTFYVLTFPSANATFVYDASTLMWHERSSWTGSPYAIGRHVGNCYACFNGLHLVGDYGNGNIYQMKTGAYTDNGQPLVSMRTAQMLFDTQGFEPVAIHRLIVDAEMGVGGSAALSWSDDGGHTWSNEHPASLGALGQYRGKLTWRKLGIHPYGWIPRSTITVPVTRVIMGAYVEGEA